MLVVHTSTQSKYHKICKTPAKPKRRYTKDKEHQGFLIDSSELSRAGGGVPN